MFNSNTRKLKKYDALFKIVGKKIASKMEENEDFKYELSNLNYETYLKLPEELKEKVEKLLEKNLKFPRSFKFNRKVKSLSKNRFNKDIDKFLEYGEKLTKKKKRVKNNGNNIFSNMKNKFNKVKKFFKKEKDTKVEENSFIEYPILTNSDILEGEVLDTPVQEYPLPILEEPIKEPEVIEVEEEIEEEKEENLPSLETSNVGIDTSILPKEALEITEVKELVNKINELNVSKKKLESRLEFVVSSIENIEQLTGLSYKDLNKNTVNKIYVDRYKQKRKINQMIKEADNAILLYSKMIEREIEYKTISSESRSIDNLEKMMKLLEELKTMSVKGNEYQNKYNEYEMSLNK